MEALVLSLEKRVNECQCTTGTRIMTAPVTAPVIEGSRRSETDEDLKGQIIEGVQRAIVDISVKLSKALDEKLEELKGDLKGMKVTQDEFKS